MNFSRSGWTLIVGSVCLLGIAGSLVPLPHTDADRAQPEAMQQSVADVSVPFIINAGQTDAAVACYASTLAGTVFVTRDGRIVYSLPGKTAAREGPRARRPAAAAVTAGWSLTEAPVDAIREARPVAQKRARTRVSYFLGSDSSAWKRGLETYEETSLGQVWQGVTVSLRAHGKNVEKVFTVQPGGDPSRIRMLVAGARSLATDRTGNLIASTAIGDVTWTRPSAFQELNGARRAISVSYEIRGDTYGFRLGGYDPDLPLVIDPLLQATYLGGSGSELGNALAIHPTTGDVYVAGYTASTNFPGTAGGARSANGGGNDAFVARLTADLKTLTQATYIGGSGDDLAYAMAIDPATGDVYVGGATTSTNLPGTSGGARSASGGSSDGFIVRLTADLKTLTQATYLGGSGHEILLALGVQSGSVYATGWTDSANFPGTAGGMQTAFDGGFFDAFVACLTADLKTLTQATYLGTSGDDQAYALALDPTSGAVYVAGYTSSTNFNGGSTDAFVALLTGDLKTLIRAALVGGNGDERAYALAIHPTSGDIYVAGTTTSTNFPGAAGGARSTNGGGNDAFVARLTADLTALIQATYLGGSGNEIAQALAISTSGDVYVSGSTASTNLPGTAKGAQAANGGGNDAFAAHLTADLTKLTQATYLGGGGSDAASALAIHPTSGDIYVAGITTSTNFPGTVGGARAASGGGNDAFVARLTADLLFATSPEAFYTLTPCRIVDTRTAAGPYGGPAIAAGANRAFVLAGQCGIPATAKSVSINLTVTQPTASGDLRAYPGGGGSPPLISTISYGPAQTRANNSVVALGPSGDLAIHSDQVTGNVQLIIDTNGYFQ